MIRASIYGRAGGDPVERQTKNGNLMVIVSLAVSAGRPDADEETQWFNLIAFGRSAKDLLRHAKISSPAWGPFTEPATPPATARNGKAGL